MAPLFTSGKAAVVTIACTFALAACQHEGELKLSGDARATPESATAAYDNVSKRDAARAKKYMVAAANPLAAQAGLEILRAGGSAVDAAIATQLALNVVEPQSSGIGGGAFLMHYAATSREIEAYDGREKAPKRSTPDMFLNHDGSKRKFHDTVPGGQSVGVPGLLSMLELAHKKHGKLPWEKLFDPAINLAKNGFEVSPRLNKLITTDRHLRKFFDTIDLFFGKDGKPLQVGARLVNKPLADTFRTIAKGGARAFYTGEIARDIVRAVRKSLINPGRMEVSDLRDYEAKKRIPICSFYRMWLVCGMPPPTSGGVTTLQILGLLHGVDLVKLEPGSAEAVHLIAEASRLAFADRNTYLADADFVSVPTNGLIDPGYLAKRAKAISPDKSMGKATPGDPGGKTAHLFGPARGHEGVSTSHISIVDGNGNAVSMTSSIENMFGSRLMVRGFLLNNQLTDFSFLPIVKGKAVANSVQGGKRPRSSMSPFLVTDGSGKLVLAVGSPGGSRIIGYVAKTLIAMLDWKMNIQAAIDLPHFVNRNGVTDLEKGSALAVLKAPLEALGHKVRLADLTSGLHGIAIGKDGILTGGADPRREGVAIGD